MLVCSSRKDSFQGFSILSLSLAFSSSIISFVRILEESTYEQSKEMKERKKEIYTFVCFTSNEQQDRMCYFSSLLEYVCIFLLLSLSLFFQTLRQCVMIMPQSNSSKS